jgi:DNA-binding transcriptional ArsR family regulator
MGITKSTLFSEYQNQLAQIFKALGHPARIAILEYLLKTKSCICGDIVDELPLAQPTISQHLKELKSAGIIQGTIEGTSVCYCINMQHLEIVKAFIEGMSVSKIENSCC